MEIVVYRIPEDEGEEGGMYFAVLQEFECLREHAEEEGFLDKNGTEIIKAMDKKVFLDKLYKRVREEVEFLTEIYDEGKSSKRKKA